MWCSAVMNKRSQKGNVLFLILIAVALFAALSYAVTQSSRGGGDAKKEDLLIEASLIMQWFAGFKTDFMRFSLNAGISQDEIRINDGFSWVPCSAGSSCLWSSDGGGVEYPPPQVDRYFSAFGSILADSYAGGSSVSGFNNPHWIMSYLGNSSSLAGLCQAYNDALGLGPFGATQNTYPGEETACFLHSSGNYTIYFVFYDS